MKILSLIFIILLSLISCRTTQTPQPNMLFASTTVYETITIASFNIQIFGNNKGRQTSRAVPAPGGTDICHSISAGT